MHAGNVLEGLRNFDPARKHRDVGHEADVAHETVALAPRITAKHSQLSLIRGKPENRVERGGLPRAVGTDQPENATFFDSQINAIKGDRCAEGLAQAACLYACHGFSDPPWGARAASTPWISASRSPFASRGWRH